METGTITIIIILTLLAAIVLDIWLLRQARHYIKKHNLGDQTAGKGVVILGAHSSLLTWLKHSALSALHKQAPQTSQLEKVDQQKSSESQPQDELVDDIPSFRWLLLELGLVALVVLLYCASILDLGENTRLPGNESEVFQSQDWALVNSLRQSGRFPIWNPYLGSGQPYVADPMVHVFNPVSTIPVLLFGVRDGFKVGVFLSFLLAAFGMWWLGRVLGLSQPARLYAALLFTFAGQPVARFFQGEYLFILGFAWIPWTLGSLLMLVKTRRRTYGATAAISLALLFFSGNVYYAFYMLILIALFFLVFVFKLQPRKPFLLVDRKLVLTLSMVGVLTLGLVSIQLLPLVELWPRIGRSLEVVAPHTIDQIYLDLTSKDTFRPDAYNAHPAREEFYAYIGNIPILAMLLLPIALWKRDRKPIVFFALLLLFTVLWIDLESMPWNQAFRETRSLAQFSMLLRILVYTSFAIILLGAIGIDTAWRSLFSQSQSSNSSVRGIVSRAAANILLATLVVLILVSVGDVYQTNRKYVGTQAVDPAIYRATRWLRQHDLSDYYIRVNPNNSSHDAVMAAGLRFIELWYPFGEIRKHEGQVNTRAINAGPNYIVQNATQPLIYPNMSLIQQIDGFNIYTLPLSLPYAFSVKRATLTQSDNPAPLETHEVIKQTSFTPGPNSVEVIASAQEDEILVLLTTHYPGWQVRVDDRPADLLNAGGYLGVKLLPGVHRYAFSFKPSSFYIGLVLSLISAILILGLLIADTRPSWNRAFDYLKISPGRLHGWLRELQHSLFAGRSFTGAVYKDGSLHPDKALNIDEGASVRVEIEPMSGVLSQPRLAFRRWTWATSDLTGILIKSISLAALLSTAALLIYAVTRFYALESYPIYFFGDEAVQTVYGENLIANRFHSQDGTLLPMYVDFAGNRWAPLLSMYFHALSLTLFGKSVLVSRATSALISLLSVGSVGLILHKFFKARFAWAGMLLVAVTPAWFLHSRTAFETVMTTSFYATFLLFYLLYRYKSPGYLYGAVVFGAMTFYTYSNAQAIIVVAAGLLFLSDFRYHWGNREIVLKALVLAAILAIPFIQFRMTRPQAIVEHLRTIGSFWYQDVPTSTKILTFAGNYLYGLSPQYWFLPNAHDLQRHRMLGFGHMQTLVFPLVLLGLAVCIANWRSSAHRTVVLAALATPVGAAMLDIGIARVLAFIIPANLMAAIGLEWLLERVKSRLPYRAVALVLFALLAWANIALLRTALVDGPLWFRDYGLYGMQYGARQLFEEAIPRYLADEPDTQILVSPTWANGSENFLGFFLTPEERKRVRMEGVGSYLFKQLPLDENMLFAITASEYQGARTSTKFGSIESLEMIPYPDGTPGFYFVRLAYAENAEAIFVQEEQARKQLVVENVTLDGQSVELRYSQIDMGASSLMFDGDAFTLMRGREANPFILEFHFPNPRTISGIEGNVGPINVTLTARLYAQADGSPVTSNHTFMNATTGTSSFTLLFDNAPETVTKVRLEILNIQGGETDNIHIRELHLLP